MTVVEVLTCARALLSDPARWTKKHLARTGASLEHGLSRPLDDPKDPLAQSFCVIGAIAHCDPNANEHGEWSQQAYHRPAVTALAESMGWTPGNTRYYSSDMWVWMTQDAEGTTHADVLAWLDRAIERAREAERQAVST